MKKIKTKNILVTVGIVILLALAITAVRNYFIAKNNS